MSNGNHPAWFRRIIRSKPIRLVVTDMDGKQRAVKVPDKAHKWAALYDIIGGLEWQDIEGYDAQGDLVVSLSAGAVTDTEAPDEETEQAATQREAELLGLMLEAQRSAMAGHESLVATTMTSMQAIVEMLTARIVALEESYWKIQAELAAMVRAQAESAGAEVDKENDGLAKMVLEAIGPAVAEKMIAGPRPGNGESGK